MKTTQRTVRKLGALAFAALLTAATLPAAAQAVTPLGAVATTSGAQIEVTTPDGEALGPISTETKVQLNASGFQSIPGGLGGIYVLIGTIDAEPWQPSQGGKTGTHFRYIRDDQQLNNAGHQRYVAFPGSQTGEEANGGVVDAEGNWSAEMTIPGPIIEVFNAAGDTETVNCTQVKCGIITFGAHGVVNPTNETFTPLEFAPEGSVVEETTPAPEPTVTTANPEPTADATDAPAASEVPGLPDVSEMSTGMKIGLFAIGLLVISSIAIVLIRMRQNEKVPGWVEQRPKGKAANAAAEESDEESQPQESAD